MKKLLSMMLVISLIFGLGGVAFATDDVDINTEKGVHELKNYWPENFENFPAGTFYGRNLGKPVEEQLVWSAFDLQSGNYAWNVPGFDWYDYKKKNKFEEFTKYSFFSSVIPVFYQNHQ